MRFLQRGGVPEIAVRRQVGAITTSLGYNARRFMEMKVFHAIAQPSADRWDGRRPMTNADEKGLSEKATRELEGQVATRPSTHFKPTNYRASFRVHREVVACWQSPNQTEDRLSVSLPPHE